MLQVSSFGWHKIYIKVCTALPSPIVKFTSVTKKRKKVSYIRGILALSQTLGNNFRSCEKRNQTLPQASVLFQAQVSEHEQTYIGINNGFILLNKQT